jgi:two-component system chemotaxis sensor kinase CheA
MLLNSFGEQVLLNSRLGHLLSDIDNNKTEILATYDQVNKIVSELHQSILSLRTLKLEGIFNRLERVARETSKAVGKKIEFIKVGSDLELDKSIVDSLIDPLTHMVRNSIDHGVEKTIDREKLGKNIVGKVTLNAYKQGNSFFIQIIDGGKGLNRHNILSKAIEKGIAKPDRKYLDTEIFNFIFANGFSTKDSASEVSGRGVGMDVVNTMISDLKGSCEIKSTLGEGTTFTIRLPMSLAMFNGSIVHIGKHSCVVPNSDFIETGRYENIESQQSSERLIKFKNRIVRAIDLSEELNIPMAIEGNDSMAIITKYKSEEYAFLISKMIRQEKIVLKKLDDDLKNVGGVSGGGILSDGQIALVLDLNLIIENKIKYEMKGAA